MKDPAERTQWCIQRHYQVPLLSCLKCQRFPCSGINQEKMEALRSSQFTEEIIEQLKARRITMYLFVMEEGRDIIEAPKNFSPDKFNEEMLAGVAEVLCVNKILVKQTKLVLKNREDRDNIRNSQQSVEPEQPKGTKRTKK